MHITDEELTAYAASNDELTAKLAQECIRLRAFPRAKWEVLDARKRLGHLYFHLSVTVAGKKFNQQLTIDEFYLHQLGVSLPSYMNAQAHAIYYEMRRGIWRQIAPEYELTEAVNTFLKKART